MRNFETILHWIVFCGSIFYCMFSFSKVSINYRSHLIDSDFEKGWTILDREVDRGDEEWTKMKNVLSTYWPWVFVHTILSLTIRAAFHSAVLSNCFYVCFSTILLVTIFGLQLTAFYIVNISVSVIACLLGIKFISLGIIIALMYYLEYIVSGLEVDRFLFIISILWLNARCISFTFDKLNAHQAISLASLPSIYAYCLYLPTLFTGPLVYYTDFEMCTINAATREKLNPAKIVKFILQLLRYTLISLVYDFLNHFIYASSVQHHPYIVERFDGWSLCGLGFTLPLNFYLKYKVIYGVANLLSSLDGIAVAPPPKCVARVHLSNFLWKHFDRGLHLWLLRYIYFPILAFQRLPFRKLIAGAVSFAFVACWHEAHPHINLWCVLNLVGVSVETAVCQNYRGLFARLRFEPSTDCLRRLQALVGAASFMHMCFSSIFFLSNWEVGIIFYKRIVFTYPIPLLPTIFICYCGSHVSLDTLNRLKL